MSCCVLLIHIILACAVHHRLGTDYAAVSRNQDFLHIWEATVNFHLVVHATDVPLCVSDRSPSLSRKREEPPPLSSPVRDKHRQPSRSLRTFSATMSRWIKKRRRRRRLRRCPLRSARYKFEGFFFYTLIHYFKIIP